MILLKFIEVNKHKQDDVGELCRYLIDERLINFSLPQYEQMQRITGLRNNEFSYDAVNKFFNEFKSKRFEK
ncbi:MAG: hypothetical protein PF485_11510 [Bacteroidales bacterium]|jgi:hypothetical protein|nr:hypothetical protein [Bacteroidales bacterium]